MNDDAQLQQRIQQAAGLFSSGRLDEAEAIYQEVLKLHGHHPHAIHQLGVLRWSQGRTDESIELIQKSIALAPFVPQFLGNLGMALTTKGELAAAVDAFQRSLALSPNAPVVLANLGNTLRMLGNCDAAADALQSALQLHPNFEVAHFNFGLLCKDLGELDLAIAAFQRALELNPEFAAAHGALLYTQLFHERYSPQEIFQAHVQWNDRHAAYLAPIQPSHANSRDPNRRLRIGYVSAYFRDHAVNFFIEPILRAHNRDEFEIFCYNDVANPDGVTANLQSLGDTWCNIVGMSDQRVYETISRDAIDILVDPAGHLACNRLPVFARKSAPVQVAFIGYQATTGLITMDYRITDAWADPPGVTNCFHTEKLIRLPDAFFCWQAPAEAPAVGLPPCIANGHITFGSLNNYCKVRPSTLQTWAALLHAVPNSQLLILTPNSANLRAHVQQFFQSQSVDPVRIRFISNSPRAEYLAQYQTVDIALDAFPFNGHTTVCDALWMGLPVVMLAGADYRSRFGGSVLRNLGLEAHISENVEDYVAIARGLASNPQQLIQLRESLREKMQSSVLMDAACYTRNLETEFRRVWNHWRAETSG